MTELNQQSFKEAISASQPSVVDFWAGWCMPCKMFAPVLEEIANELDGKASFYKLNVDDFGEIAQEYSITSIPTVIVFKNGQAVDRMVGVLPKDHVIDAVTKHME